jgi:chromosome segregation ATPase
MEIKKSKTKSIINNNNDVFDIEKIEIKTQEDFRLPKRISKILLKSNQNGKSNKMKDQYIKTENNQKLIFNNVGIHYHRAKNNNRGEAEKAEINMLKSQIKSLLKKNEILTTEKAERDKKIDVLEEKIDKLLNYIKEKKLSSSGEDNEKNNLKNKINNLENCVNYLKSENNELKKEIEKKNKIILSLSNSQIESSPSHKKNVSIGKKKEKGEKSGGYRIIWYLCTRIEEKSR